MKTKSLKRPEEIFAKPVTTPHLASTLAVLEGKKSEASVGDVREILGLIVKIELASYRYDGRNRISEWLAASVAAKQAKKQQP